MSDKMIEINYAILGARFANEGDDKQAEFFHSFARELASWPSHYEQELQLASVARLLSKEDRALLANVFALFSEETT